MDIDILQEKIKKFNNDRDWDKFHSPQNLAKSISIEAGELLECFQWGDDYCIDDLSDEMADVFIYLLVLSNKIGVDLIDVSYDKINKNEVKYPVEKAKGNAKKYTKF